MKPETAVLLVVGLLVVGVGVFAVVKLSAPSPAQQLQQLQLQQQLAAAAKKQPGQGDAIADIGALGGILGDAIGGITHLFG